MLSWCLGACMGRPGSRRKQEGDQTLAKKIRAAQDKNDFSGLLKLGQELRAAEDRVCTSIESLERRRRNLQEKQESEGFTERDMGKLIKVMEELTRATQKKLDLSLLTMAPLPGKPAEQT